MREVLGSIPSSSKDLVPFKGGFVFLFSRARKFFGRCTVGMEIFGGVLGSDSVIVWSLVLQN